jgi:hypothetical protein
MRRLFADRLVMATGAIVIVMSVLFAFWRWQGKSKVLGNISAKAVKPNAFAVLTLTAGSTFAGLRDSRTCATMTCRARCSSPRSGSRNN